MYLQEEPASSSYCSRAMKAQRIGCACRVLGNQPSKASRTSPLRREAIVTRIAAVVLDHVCQVTSQQEKAQCTQVYCSLQYARICKAAISLCIQLVLSQYVLYAARYFPLGIPVTVIEDLAKAKSRITVSFDSQKVDNEVLDLLSIVAHYINRDCKVKTVTLALRDTYGSYSSENIKDYLLAVLRKYQISNEVAYFATNNAINNNEALKLLATKLSINAESQQLRCLGYVINLVSNAVLYSVDKDCIDKVLDAINKDVDVDADSQAVNTFVHTIASEDKALRLLAWRKKGPISKLYLLIVQIKHSNARRVFFKSKQRKAASKACQLY